MDFLTLETIEETTGTTVVAMHGAATDPDTKWMLFHFSVKKGGFFEVRHGTEDPLLTPYATVAMHYYNEKILPAGVELTPSRDWPRYQKTIDPVALSKELAQFDLREVTQEDINGFSTTGLLKLSGMDKMLLVHCFINKPPQYEVKGLTGHPFLLQTADLQTAMAAYNQAEPRKENGAS